VARVVYARNALASLERSFQSLAEVAPDAAADAVRAIRSAVEMLANTR